MNLIVSYITSTTFECPLHWRQYEIKQKMANHSLSCDYVLYHNMLSPDCIFDLVNYKRNGPEHGRHVICFQPISQRLTRSTCIKAARNQRDNTSLTSSTIEINKTLTIDYTVWYLSKALGLMTIVNKK